MTDRTDRRRLSVLSGGVRMTLPDSLQWTGTPPGLLRVTRDPPGGPPLYTTPLAVFGRIWCKGCNGLPQAPERKNSIEGGCNSPVGVGSTRVNGGGVK